MNNKHLSVAGQLTLAREQGRKYAADDLATALANIAQLEKNCTEIHDAMTKEAAQAKFFETVVQSQGRELKRLREAISEYVAASLVNMPADRVQLAWMKLYDIAHET